jgi:hypothetical protein
MGLDINSALDLFINKDGNAKPTPLLLALQKYGLENDVNEHTKIAGVIRTLMTAAVYDKFTLFMRNEQMPTDAEVDAFFRQVAMTITQAAIDRKLAVAKKQCNFYKTGVTFLMENARVVFESTAKTGKAKAIAGVSKLGNAAKGEVAKVPAGKSNAAKGEVAKVPAGKGKGNAAKGEVAKVPAGKGEDAAPGKPAAGNAAKGEVAKVPAGKGEDAAPGKPAAGNASKAIAGAAKLGNDATQLGEQDTTKCHDSKPKTLLGNVNYFYDKLHSSLLDVYASRKRKAECLQAESPRTEKQEEEVEEEKKVESQD